MAAKPSPHKPRINRSISFPDTMLEALKARARKEKRSVNWLVNQAVEKDLRSAG